MAPGAEPERVIEVPVRTLDDILIEARAPGAVRSSCRSTSKATSWKCSAGSISRAGSRACSCLEDHVGNLEKHRFLKAAGYRLIRRFENNGWYVPRHAAVAVAPRERWEIVRKYYLGLPFRIARNASRALRRRAKERLTDELNRGAPHAALARAHSPGCRVRAGRCRRWRRCARAPQRRAWRRRTKSCISS